MLVLVFVIGCFCIVSFLIGRAARLNAAIRRGDAAINLDTGEILDPDSRAYRRERARGAVRFKLDD